MFHLRLFGSPSIEGPDGIPLIGRAAQRHRIALLSVLAIQGGRGPTRDRLVGLLWPESGLERARNLLKVSIYVLRQKLGEDALLSEGDELRLNPDRVSTDVGAFEAKFARGEFESAVEIYAAPFMDGFYLRDAHGYEHWVEQQRSRLFEKYCDALESLADATQRLGDLSSSVRWWTRRAELDPYDSRIAIRLMQAFEAGGNPAGAIRHAMSHAALLRAELGIEPTAELRALERRLRSDRESAADAGPDPTGHPAATEITAVPELGPRSATALHLQTLGGLALHGPPLEATDAGRQDPRLLALLAILAAAGAQGVTRDRLLLLLWPESRQQEARESLDQLLESIRSSVAADAVLGTDPLALNPAVIATDLRHRPEPAGISHRTGNDGHESFLDGFELVDSPEFREWKEAERQRLATPAEMTPESAPRAGAPWSVTPVAPPVTDSSAVRSGLRWIVLGAATVAIVAIILLSRPPAAGDVAATLSREMTTATSSRGTARSIQTLARNPAAFELYELCSHSRMLRTDSLAGESLDCLRRATDMDPMFPAAWSALALIYLRTGPPDEPGMSFTDRLERAHQYALQATSLDPTLGATHRTLGLVLTFRYRFDEAESELNHALALDPTDSRAIEFLVHLEVFRQRFAEALALATKGIGQDPLSPTMNAELARAYLVNGKCDNALAQLDRLRDLDPPVGRAGLIAAECHGLRNEWVEAIEELENAENDGATHWSELAFYYARAGRIPDAQRILEELTSQWQHVHDNAYRIALVHWGLANLDSTFAWLDRSVDDHSFSYETMHPRWERVRADPRFDTLLRRVGLMRR